MDKIKKFGFGVAVFIIVAALVTSGHAAFEVLVTYLGTPWYFALLAALVVDATVIYLGTHSIELVTLGDKATKARYTTVVFIFASVALNFFYGYMLDTNYITGLLQCIYPVAGAIVYEAFVEKQVRKQRQDAGMILPEMPAYSKKYQDKAEVQQLHKDYAAGTLADARVHMEYKFATRRKELGYTVDTPVLHVPSVLGTQLQDVPQVVTQEDTDWVQELDTVFDSVTKEDTQGTLPDWLSTDMDTPEITKACVANGVTDLKEVKGYVLQVNDTVKEDTIKMSLRRAKQAAGLPTTTTKN